MKKTFNLPVVTVFSFDCDALCTSAESGEITKDWIWNDGPLGGGV